LSKKVPQARPGYRPDPAVDAATLPSGPHSRDLWIAAKSARPSAENPRYLCPKHAIMRKLFVLASVTLLLLTACLETESHTVINEDGSGKMEIMIDLSGMMQMMANEENKPEDFLIDTTVQVRSFSDTASSLTAYEKELLRGMEMRIFMDARDLSGVQFKVGLAAPFRSLDDFNALNALMRKKEFDQVFDKAMEIPALSPTGKDEEEEKGEKGEKDDDNILSMVFPDYFSCHYGSNAIECKLDSVRYKATLAAMKESDIDVNGELETAMFSEAVFTNRLTLPSKVKKMEGESWKKGNGDNELVQTGNVLDLYKNPQKYVYSIHY